VAACVGATWLAARDRQAGWATTVAVSTATLAALTVRVLYADEHPDRAATKAARRADRERALAEEILRRHRGEPARPVRRATRADRRAAAQRARTDAILAAYERDRAARR
jgi:hypothetical protein